eukprot:scaffold7071_cov260-Pinguiococcus_pyrenoidosus.AAC.4
MERIRALKSTEMAEKITPPTSTDNTWSAEGITNPLSAADKGEWRSFRWLRRLAPGRRLCRAGACLMTLKGAVSAVGLETVVAGSGEVHSPQARYTGCRRPFALHSSKIDPICGYKRTRRDRGVMSADEASAAPPPPRRAQLPAAVNSPMKSPSRRDCLRSAYQARLGHGVAFSPPRPPRQFFQTPEKGEAPFSPDLNSLRGTQKEVERESAL